MEEKKMTGNEFADRFEHSDIKSRLRLFSYVNKKEMPSILIKDNTCGILMIDVLKVANTDVVLPVVVRSTNWLQAVNNVYDKSLVYCLHDEIWPALDRIGIVGGLCELSEDDFENPLFEYLTFSINHWKRFQQYPVFASDRVKQMAKSDGLKKLLEKIEIIELSDEYKKLEVEMGV